MLDDKIEAMAKEEYTKLTGAVPDRNVADQAIKKRFVTEATHAICVAIYKEASQQGKMIV
jgi:hypothetical protein